MDEKQRKYFKELLANKVEDQARDRDFNKGMLELKRSGVDKADSSFFKQAVNRTKSGDDFAKKIARMTKSGGGLKKGLKSFPLLGSIVAGLSALSSGDAAAAIPILDQADDLGPSAESLEGRFERGELTPEERMRFLKRLEEK